MTTHRTTNRTTDGDDALRARIARHDPARGLAVDDPDGPAVRALVERVVAAPAGSTAGPSHPRPARRWALVLAGAAAALAVGVGGGTVLAGRDPGVSTRPAPVAVATFTVPASDPATQMCLAFEPGVLEGVPVALAGTVTAVDAAGVTLAVDRWFAGGEAEGQARLLLPDAGTALETGLTFRTGERWLVAVRDGVVQGCGASGPEAAGLRSAYEQVFGQG